MEKTISLVIILLTLFSYLLNKRKVERNKLSIYECGNQRFNDIINSKYYIFYYKIAIIYLIFDLEIIILLPICNLNILNLPYIEILSILFLIGLGIIYEIYYLKKTI